MSSPKELLKQASNAMEQMDLILEDFPEAKEYLKPLLSEVKNSLSELEKVLNEKFPGGVLLGPGGVRIK